MLGVRDKTKILNERTTMTTTVLEVVNSTAVRVTPTDRYILTPDRMSEDLKRLGPWRKEEKGFYVPGDDRLELEPVVRGDETDVHGGVVLKRVEEVTCAGQGYAEPIARNHRIVPPAWHNLNLLFPGTIWFCRDNRAFVSALYCSRHLARLFYFPAGQTFNKFFRIVRVNRAAAN